MSNSKIICTANDIDSIPGYIINRFGNNVFRLPDYNAEDKTEIALRYIIPAKLLEFGISEDDLSFSPDAVHYIAEYYCDDAGARKIGGYIETLFRKAIRGWCTGKEQKPLRIDAEYVKSHLKKSDTQVRRKAGF